MRWNILYASLPLSMSLSMPLSVSLHISLSPCNRWRTATHTEYRMVVLNLVQRIYDAIKKHLSSSIDAWAVNVWYI